jgi:sodium transport system permease protein
MKLRQAKIVFLKELLETLRDKRTLMVMILGPVAVYPILILVMVSLSRVQQGKLEQETSRVMLVGEAVDAGLTDAFLADEHIDLHVRDTDADARSAVKSGRMHGAVVLSRDVAAPADAAPPGTIVRGLVRAIVVYDEADERSELAYQRIMEILDSYSREEVTGRIAQLDEGEEYAYPLVIRRESVGTPEAVGRRVLGYAIPMMLVLMTIAGSMYPAIDTTAGEKERGTIETILTTPAGITEIVAGKFMTVFIIAIATGLLNLAGMGLSLAAIGGAAQQQIDLALPLGAALFMVLFLLPLAFLFSSVMMAVAMYARTFKEAQNYASPIYLLCVIPAMMSTLPAFELTPFLCIVPVVGVTLLLKELLQGAIVPDHLALVFFSTTLYAYLALRITVRLFHNENVLFSSERPFALFVGRRRLARRPVPTPGEALLLAVVCFVLFFVVGGIVARRVDFRLADTITMLGLILAPALLFAKYLKLDVRRTFSLRAPSVISLVLTAAAAIAAIVVVLEIQYVQSTLLPHSKELERQMEEQIDLTRLGLLEKLAFIALFPAICEEMLFRGFILSGLGSRLRPLNAALVVGVLFGFFHIGPVTLNVIPVSHILIGTVMALLVWYARSIFAGMLFHLTYNGMLVSMPLIAPALDRAGLGGLWLDGQGHAPVLLLIPAVVLMAVALAGVIARDPRRQRA